MGCVESNRGVHTGGGNGNGNGKMHICLYLTQFLSVAVAVTKWVQNPFTNDAIAIAIATPSSVNTPIGFHITHP